jgi:hypothetical protein
MGRKLKSFLITVGIFAGIAAGTGLILWAESTTLTLSPVETGVAVVAVFFGMVWLVVHEMIG